MCQNTHLPNTILNSNSYSSFPHYVSTQIIPNADKSLPPISVLIIIFPQYFKFNYNYYTYVAQVASNIGLWKPQGA